MLKIISGKDGNYIYSLSYAEINTLLAETDDSRLPVYSVSILRNIMVEPIESFLKYEVLQLGSNMSISLGEYDNIYQESVGCQQGPIASTTDCVLVFLSLWTLSPDLSFRFSALSNKEVKQEMDRVVGVFSNILDGIRLKTSCPIIFSGFEEPYAPAMGVLESQAGIVGQRETIRSLNYRLQEKLAAIKNAYFLDLNTPLSTLGAKKYYDHRLWHIGRIPYTLEGFREIAQFVAAFIRILLAKTCKCIVLDADNVLWGGIIGEDGIEGIKLGASHPGSCYQAFQQEVLNLFNKGVILAICSKNNEEDVIEVIRNHPYMLIKEEHIASMRINWSNKADNIRAIANELNIGLESIVFIDDSEFEINLVSELVPEVSVLQFSTKKPVETAIMLSECRFFDSLTLSGEDKRRGAMYKAEVERKNMRSQVSDIEEYLKSLEMELTISRSGDFEIPRVVQLTQKTNQFNLTTRRYSEDDIRSMIQSDNYGVFHASLKDRFGDMGIIGVCIIHTQKEKNIIDTFLLSCRVLSRGVEEIFIKHMIWMCSQVNSKDIVGKYIPTKKNSQVAFFYKENGFVETDLESGEWGFSVNVTMRHPQTPPTFLCVNVSY
jgi:FkbH-like protein